VNVDGGAVEFSWVLQTPLGNAVSRCSCSEPRVASVQLALTPAEGEIGTQAEPRFFTFACEARTGTTPLSIPEGFYDTRIVALSPEGEDLVDRGVVTPAPIRRAIVWGKPAELGALQIITGCAPSCANANGGCSD
jgi:hypothetical protein